MKRFYSHYSFIYPDIYLKNHIVELDDNHKITKVFPYEKEVEKTEFYSGILVFLPHDIDLVKDFFDMENKDFFSAKGTYNLPSQIHCVYHEDMGKIVF